MLTRIQSPIKFFMTGHTGFKGTWLTILLHEMGHSVVGYSLPPEKDSLYSRLNGYGLANSYYGDIRNYDQVLESIKLEKPDVIIHFAAQSLVLSSYKNPRTTFETNSQGTVNVLDAAFQVGTVRTVLVSTTDKVYKNDNEGYRFKESDSLQGDDPYSASKVSAEAACRAWQTLSELQKGPRILVARAGNVIGGGDLSPNRLIPDVIRAHQSDKRLLVRNLEATRPWQHVLDPLLGYIKFVSESLERDVPTAMNFGPSERSLSVKEVLEFVSSDLDSEIEVIAASVQAKESQQLSISSELASSVIDWKPSWSQEIAIKRTLMWWKNFLNEGKSPLDNCLKDVEELFLVSTEQKHITW